MKTITMGKNNQPSLVNAKYRLTVCINGMIDCIVYCDDISTHEEPHDTRIHINAVLNGVAVYISHCDKVFDYRTDLED